MDDSEKPTVETEGLPPEPAEWQMPQPVFRSTAGTNLKDPEKEIPTESANKSEQTVRVREDALGNRHKKKKKGGCAKFFTLLAVVIGLIVGSTIVALVYFLFYYRPSSTTF